MYPCAVVDDGGLLVELLARPGRVDERGGNLARPIEKPIPVVAVRSALPSQADSGVWARRRTG